MNIVVVSGRLTRDPEVRATQSGTKITTFNVAVDRPPKQNGESEADFIDCQAYGKTGEFIANYFQKGRKIEVSGRLNTYVHEDKQGQKRKYTSVICNRAEFADSKGQQPRQPQQTQQAYGAHTHAPLGQQPQQNYGAHSHSVPPQGNPNNTHNYNQQPKQQFETYGAMPPFDEEIPF